MMFATSVYEGVDDGVNVDFISLLPTWCIPVFALIISCLNSR